MNMHYKHIDGVTYYKLRSKPRHSPVIGLVALLIVFGFVAGYLGSTFGYSALG